MYKEIYKCRLCGKTFIVGKRYSDKKAIEKIARVGMILPFAPNDLAYTAHGCEDGSYGIADLQGFKKTEG